MWQHGIHRMRFLTNRAALIACAIRVAPFVGSALACLPAAAQNAATAPAAKSETVVVTGRPTLSFAQVRALARSITPDAVFAKPLPRFSDPVCFAVVGLPAPFLTTITDRMVDDAQRAGVRLAGERCGANVVVMFVDDGRAELERLRRRQPAFFGELSPSEVGRLVRAPGPVHVLHTCATAARDGDPLHTNGGVGPPILNVATSSHVDLPIRRDIQRAVLLIDRAAVVGMDPMQLADYAAVRALTTARPARSMGHDTILDLFASNDERVPAEATTFDREYIKALYSGAPNHRGSVKVGEMVRDIARGSRRHDGPGESQSRRR